jgi:hypothetical protein
LIYEHISKEGIMRGGKRMGAGRKVGSNAYMEPTKPMRVPLSIVDVIQHHNGTTLSAANGTTQIL